MHNDKTDPVKTAPVKTAPPNKKSDTLEAPKKKSDLENTQEDLEQENAEVNSFNATPDAPFKLPHTVLKSLTPQLNALPVGPQGRSKYTVESNTLQGSPTTAVVGGVGIAMGVLVVAGMFMFGIRRRTQRRSAHAYRALP